MPTRLEKCEFCATEAGRILESDLQLQLGLSSCVDRSNTRGGYASDRGIQMRSDRRAALSGWLPLPSIHRWRTERRAAQHSSSCDPFWGAHSVSGYAAFVQWAAPGTQPVEFCSQCLR